MKMKNLVKYLKGNIFLISLVSFFWFLFRSGLKPSRAAYPCQQVALTQFSSYFLFIYPFTRFKKAVCYFRYHFGFKDLFKVTLVVLGAAFIVKAGAYSLAKYTEYRNIHVLSEHRNHLPVGLSSDDDPSVNSAFAQVNDQRVVSVHDSDATNWDHSTGYHWQYIDQDTVDAMFNLGVMTLTGTSSAMDAWSELIPYEEGDQVAIKFNFNNSYTCAGGDDQDIDGYSETANAIIDGLISIGVPADDIWIYDAMKRVVPNRFISGIENQDVRFFGGAGDICNGNYQVTSFVDAGSDDTSEFTCTAGNLSQDVIRPAQVLVDAEHLINVPLFKSHGYYITLALKNHYGSVYYSLYDNNSMHQFFTSTGSGCDLYSENILADISNNPHIRNKTRLIVGEGIFGNPYTNYQSIERWSIFGNDDPNIYFFSTDPIAISSVMTDYIMEERGWQDHWQLHAGASLGLGVHEHWDNFTNKQYSAIEYIEIDLDDPQVPDIRLYDPIAPSGDQDLPFGGVNEGYSVEQTVTVYNDGAGILTIGSVAGTNPLASPFSIADDACSGQNIVPGGHCAIAVNFSPDATGGYSDSFDIPSNDPDESDLTVTVSGTGQPPGTNNPPFSPLLVYPENGQTGLGTTVMFIWKTSIDPDGDEVNYEISYCENQDFSNCDPIQIALNEDSGKIWPKTAGGLFLLGTVFIGFVSGNRKGHLIVLLLVPVLFIASCGSVIEQNASGIGPDEAAYTATGLDPNTQYYWKVNAEDGQGGEQESEVWNFTTD